MTFLDNTGLAYFWSKLKALFATKSELEVVRQSASKAYHYKGSVAAVSDLPANAEQGDVYNVGTTLDGDNYAWTGTAWDKLGASVDLSPYALDADVVKLTGDQTVGGVKNFNGLKITSLGNIIKESNSGQTLVCAGTTNSATGGAYLTLRGAESSTTPGRFALTAAAGGSSKTLRGDTDGTLTWNSKAIAIDEDVVHKTGDETVGGVKTFSNGIVVAGTDSLVSIKSTSDAGIVRVGGGSDGKITTGAVLMAIGKSSSLYTGQFRLFASDGTKSKVFVGTPDGTLTWDGKDIITNGGDQTIAGTKTFSISPICERGNPYFITCETDLEKGVAPSGTTYQGVVFKDKNAVEVGSVFFSVGKSSNLPYGSVVFRNAGNGTTADNHELVFRETTNSIWHFMPSNTTDINLGGSGNYRWKEVWSVTGAINTSDERLKDNIASVPDAVLDAWGDVKWSQFQMRDAITEKGVDKARLHNGLIAQRIEEVFKAHGQDASRYGLFCHDAWDADEEREAGDEYSLRYEEALCMEAAYQRRRADRAEARISELERRLNEMEAAIASLISPVA